MKFVVGLCFLAACAFATPVARLSTPTKPNPPADFGAKMNAEIYQHDQKTIFGQGHWYSDVKAGKSEESYEFEVGPLEKWYQVDLQRYDLKQEYEIASYDKGECKVRVLNETAQSPFAFLANASYIGEDEYHHAKIFLWQAKYGDLHITLGVADGDPDTPVTLEYSNHHGAQKLYFAEFEPNPTFNTHQFDIPHGCGGMRAPRPQYHRNLRAAAPKRPYISPTFVSEYEQKYSQAGHDYEGVGKWVASQRLESEANEIKYREKYHAEHAVFFLDRFDLHHAYEITSTDHDECIERDLKGNFTSPWEFVKDAKYKGEKRENGELLQFWEYERNGFFIALGVAPNKPDIPKTLFQKTKYAEQFMNFTHFDPVEPHREDFDIPQPCQN